MPATMEVFVKYPNRILVESGTFYCGGVDLALRAGFKEVRSIELDDGLFWEARERYRTNPKVTIYQGDSGVVLEEVLRDIMEPVTFWLDGHFSGEGTAKGVDNSPVLRELACIKRHAVRTHAILIDDVRLMGTPAFDGVALGDLAQVLWGINPVYRLVLEDGGEGCPHDVLAASV